MKEHMLIALMELFNRWEGLIGNLSEAQRRTRLEPGEWTPKDVLAHLLAWQERSIARLTAAQADTTPDFPKWAPGVDPEEEASTDVTNAWIYAAYKDMTWAEVYQTWKEGFLRFVEVNEIIPERDLLDSSRYPWLEGQPLAVVLLGLYDHHQEHYEKLAAWLQEHH